MTRAEVASRRDDRAARVARAASDFPHVKERVGRKKPFWSVVLGKSNSVEDPVGEWEATYAKLPTSANTGVVERTDVLLIVDCDFREYEDVVHGGAKLPATIHGPVPTRHVNEFFAIDGRLVLRQRIYYMGDDAAADEALQRMYKWQHR